LATRFYQQEKCLIDNGQYTCCAGNLQYVDQISYCLPESVDGGLGNITSVSH